MAGGGLQREGRGAVESAAVLTPMTAWLSELVHRSGSDLLLASGLPPAVRVHGRLQPISVRPLPPEELEGLLGELLGPREQARLGLELNLDFAHEAELPGHGRVRFRGNAYRQRQGHSLVFRRIPQELPHLDELGLPAMASRFTELSKGLVLVTGSTGAGKTTSLAAMVRYLNEHRPVHIITVEDPIEYVHENRAGIVVQRQVGVHVESFQRALRAALREDPDVIVVAELRDLETIQLAITAAETGHLVLGTLHTVSASQTVARIVNAFPANQQWQVRTMLSESLRAIFSQQLLPRRGGQGRVAAVEILLNTDAVAHLIREDRLHQLPAVMEAGGGKGMRLMDHELLRLVREGVVDTQEALDRAHDKQDFAQRVGLRSAV